MSAAVSSGAGDTTTGSETRLNQRAAGAHPLLLSFFPITTPIDLKRFFSYQGGWVMEEG